MTTKTQLKTLTRAGQRTNRVIHTSAPITIRQRTPIIIDVPHIAVQKSTNTLSAHLERGRQLHPLCRHSFIERIELGYYHYERRTEYRTCALAAAYAGAFGAASIERPNFSYSMAVWQLSQKLGYDLRQTAVTGPTGRVQSVADEMMALNDWDYWNREGVAAWLKSLDL